MEPTSNNDTGIKTTIAIAYEDSYDNPAKSIEGESSITDITDKVKTTGEKLLKSEALPNKKTEALLPSRIKKRPPIAKRILNFVDENLKDYEPTGFNNNGKSFGKLVGNFLKNFIKPNHKLKKFKTSIKKDSNFFAFQVEITNHMEARFGPGAAIPYATRFNTGKLRVSFHMHENQLTISLNQPLTMIKQGETEIQRCIDAIQIPSALDWGLSWFGSSPKENVRDVIRLNEDIIEVHSFIIDHEQKVHPYTKQLKNDDSQKYDLVPVKDAVHNADTINEIYDTKIKTLQEQALSFNLITKERFNFNEAMRNFYLSSEGVPIKDLTKYLTYAELDEKKSDKDYYQLYWQPVQESPATTD